MKILSIYLAFFLLLLSVASFTVAISVSQDFTDAIDAAAYELVNDASFKSYYQEMMSFPVPTCATKVSYPTTNPFSGRTSLVVAMETGTLSPWLEVKTKVGQGIIGKWRHV